MSLESAVRLAEILLGFALLQQSLEYVRGLSPEKMLGGLRALLAVLLMLGVQPVWVETGLLLLTVLFIKRFNGPYNGGSDTMSILVLLCLWLSHLAPSRFWQEIALGYLAFQLTFSYFQAGYIKVINGDWRSGRALEDVFALTAYPVSEQVRTWAESPRVMWCMSWSVMLFELLFPLALLNAPLLYIALGVAALFHLANACLFGLNRFFWSWPAAYPIIIWFQDRLF